MRPARSSGASAGLRPVRSPNTTVVDVLDRVLDKGIVIDATVRVSLVGIELIGVDARVVVASIATYVARSPELDGRAPAAPPPSARTAAPAPRPPATSRRTKRTRARTRASRPVTTPQLLGCVDGCSFARVVDPRSVDARLPDIRPCPYGQRRVCVLRPR